MPTGVEPYGDGFRYAVHIRSCTFPTPDAAAQARAELVQATKRLRLRQKIRKLEQEPTKGDS